MCWVGGARGNKTLKPTSSRTFMVKKDAITGKHIVSFPVVDHNPVSI